jgi:hypothetical protein
MLAETSVLTPKGTKTLSFMSHVFLVESAKRRRRNDLAVDLNQGARREGAALGESCSGAAIPLGIEKGSTLEATRFSHGVVSRSNFNSIALRSWQTARSIAWNYLIGSWDEGRMKIPPQLIGLSW